MTLPPGVFGGSRTGVSEIVQQRRRLQSATLRTPDDRTWLYDGDLGSRLGNVVYSTRMNAGYDTLTATLLSRDGQSNLIPFAEANTYFGTWDFGLLRFMLAGESVWAGKLWQPTITSWVEDDILGPCVTMQIECSGLFEDMTNKLAHVNGDYTDEFATVSLTELARDFMKQDTSLLFRKPIGKAGYGPMMAETGINIATGGLSVGVTDYPQSMLINGLKAGSGVGHEYWVGVFEPELGFWIQLRDNGFPRWRLPMRNFNGQIVKNLHEYANRVIAFFTDGENSNMTTEWTDQFDADLAASLHNGVTRERSISIDRVGADGAAAGRDTFFNDHRNPIGFNGQFIFNAADQGNLLIPVVPNWEDGYEPCYRVHCGTMAVIPDMLPFDPNMRDLGRQWGINTTSHDVDSGQFTVTLDERTYRSRPSEQPIQIANTLHALEPAMSRKFKVTRTSDNHFSIGRNNDVELTDDSKDPELLVQWTPVRNTTVRISMTIIMSTDGGGTPANDDAIYWGFTLNDETFNKSDEERTETMDWTSGTNFPRTLSKWWDVNITAEPLVIHFWARADSPDTTYGVNSISISVED